YKQGKYHWSLPRCFRHCPRIHSSPQRQTADKSGGPGNEGERFPVASPSTQPGPLRVETCNAGALRERARVRSGQSVSGRKDEPGAPAVKASNLKQSQTTSKAAENEIVLPFPKSPACWCVSITLPAASLNANRGISWAVIWESPWNSL